MNFRNIKLKLFVYEAANSSINDKERKHIAIWYELISMPFTEEIEWIMFAYLHSSTTAIQNDSKLTTTRFPHLQGGGEK